ncbi:thioredoxin domain-containing protein [Streptomyces sp. NPDC093228]|uniref:DsbA family protein n=1 Tax=unclassified Streptomyces TaxID=2593676 RepID=UPI000D14F15D|nr:MULTISPECIES: thioredoxin domain-containing protein [unclassified Streptomyces]MDX3258537.1 thioredoxin domain-containing protein [Streptomyces sp. MI02-2A]
MSIRTRAWLRRQPKPPRHRERSGPARAAVGTPGPPGHLQSHRIRRRTGPRHPALRAHLRDRVHRPTVERHMASADANAVTGTPTFFINGKRHRGPYDDMALLTAIEEAAHTQGQEMPGLSVPYAAAA